MSESLDRQFTAKLQKSDNTGGWTYVVTPDSAAFFGTLPWMVLSQNATG